MILRVAQQACAVPKHEHGSAAVRALRGEENVVCVRAAREATRREDDEESDTVGVSSTSLIRWGGVASGSGQYPDDQTSNPHRISTSHTYLVLRYVTTSPPSVCTM